MKFGKSHVVGVAALAIAASLTASTPATAATSKDSPLLSTERGNARFYHDGDKLVVCDTLADGRAAKAWVTDAATHLTYITATAPSLGECSTASVNIPEGTTVKIDLDFVNSTDPVIQGPSGEGVA